ncbi:ATP-binding cassette domain-containing protein [Bacillus tamaricis]|uniref:ATP-binding cassette domain-containing protein n=1 Tax=Evansella tamaricis TaxID=2069301 RepID=A0ABS6JJ80_9BACI|nr:ATP-binding cassette domain-containing protein [Evansella tamaricis]MBU9712897.1 ATP-binding cassette domain-containing protein [Evansella tamaricis]
MLEVVDLKKKFKKTEAVRGMNMFIEEGEIIGLLGPNGAGKSTTISMISSLIKPTEGDVFIKGESIVKDPTVIRPILGVVPQEIALFLDLTAKENMVCQHLCGQIFKGVLTCIQTVLNNLVIHEFEYYCTNVRSQKVQGQVRVG